jgi:hypothetical protein
MSILKIFLLDRESSLTTLQAGFVRHKACKLMLKSEVVQRLPLLQLLFQLIHHPLLLFNGTNTRSKLLLLLDGAIGSGLG